MMMRMIKSSITLLGFLTPAKKKASSIGDLSRGCVKISTTLINSLIKSIEEEFSSDNGDGESGKKEKKKKKKKKKDLIQTQVQHIETLGGARPYPSHANLYLAGLYTTKKIQKTDYTFETIWVVFEIIEANWFPPGANFKHVNEVARTLVNKVRGDLEEEGKETEMYRYAEFLTTLLPNVGKNFTRLKKQHMAYVQKNEDLFFHHRRPTDDDTDMDEVVVVNVDPALSFPLPGIHAIGKITWGDMVEYEDKVNIGKDKKMEMSYRLGTNYVVRQSDGTLRVGCCLTIRGEKKMRKEDWYYATHADARRRGTRQPEIDDEHVLVDVHPSGSMKVPKWLYIRSPSEGGPEVDKSITRCTITNTCCKRDGARCTLHAGWDSCGQALLRPGKLVYIDLRDSHNVGRDTLFVGVRHVTRGDMNASDQRLRVGCKCAVLKVPLANHTKYYNGRVGVVMRCFDQNGYIMEGGYTRGHRANCALDKYEDSLEKDKERKMTMGYAEVEFVDSPMKYDGVSVLSNDGDIDSRGGGNKRKMAGEEGVRNTKGKLR